MRKRIWLYLAIISCCLLAWARFRQPPIVARSIASHTRLVPSNTSAPLEPTRQLPSAVPSELIRSQLEPALRDPFADMVVQSAPPPAPPPQSIAAQPPSAPSLNLVFSGRMTTPDGKKVVFVKDGNEATSLSEGQVLSSGYRVRSITEQVVEFDYPSLNITARMELPPAPMQEIR